MQKEPTDKLEVENYGEMLAVINDLELVSYETDGGYQGEYLAILKDKDRLFYYTDDFGSCTGCDWLEDEDYEPTYQAARDFCGDIKPKYIVPIDQPLEFTSKEYDGWELKK